VASGSGGESAEPAPTALPLEHELPNLETLFQTQQWSVLQLVSLEYLIVKYSKNVEMVCMYLCYYSLTPINIIVLDKYAIIDKVVECYLKHLRCNLLI